MTAITFDGVTLPNPAPLKYKETADSYEITIGGFADDRTAIDALIAKAGHAAKSLLLSGKIKIQTTGILGDLVISGFGSSIDGTYLNCVIMDGVKVEEVEGTGPTPRWRYNVTFMQDTTT